MLPNSISIQMIETFILVHDLYGVTKTAKALGCCQAAITNRLKELDKLLPTPVFMPGRGNYALSDFGIQFMDKSRKVLEAYNSLRMVA